MSLPEQPSTGRAPIDDLLDEVEWREIPIVHVSMADDPDALYATHEGTLAVAGLELRCYVLNDGQRVFDADALAAAFAAQLSQGSDG